ncbi:hypothetical protein G4B88_002549 [Cannabis sativa]|uniref:3'(2'),5'-bisphosphate nucleotidase n=1 Tax=Cannabis sativa TaxID=3483 RepID=A0A7J6I8P8_CANSA|nr:hypothetical protein G4B88_002549 [Cannabis sativa]
MAINCWRLLPKTPFSTKPNSVLPVPPSSSFSRRASLVVAAAAFSPMTYDKELAAAKKAASLAATLCQASLTHSLFHYLSIYLWEMFLVKDIDSVDFKFVCLFVSQKVQKALLQSDVHSKSDKSPVTVADYGSQAVVSFVLEKELPTELFSLVAEEDTGDLRTESGQETLQRITKLVNDSLGNEEVYADTPSLSTEDVLRAIDHGKSEGGAVGRHWVLDPIDDEGKVVLGVLACPNLPLASINQHSSESSHDKVGCLFFAKVGEGTYMQSLDGSSPVKVHVSAIENPEEASFFESFEAAHSLHDLSSSIAKKLGVKAPPVRIDSQAKYGALSRGDGAIYLRFPHKGYREKIWDHAAGCIVVTEAGGEVTDAAGNPLDFSKGKYLDLDTGIIVTNKKLMPSLLKAVRASIEEKVSSL